MPNIFIRLGLVFAACALLWSCGSIKNTKYFADIPDSLALQDIPTATYQEPVIQSDDMLYIAIQLQDPTAGTNVNQLNNPTANPLLSTSNFNPMGVSAAQNTGYLVDRNGEVTIPIMGNVKLSGLTTQQARLLVQEKAKQFFKEPTVILRFSNFKISVLGEVTRPGTYTVPNERVTVLDALGYAGDLTIFGKRENILLLRRQADGNTVATHLNLNSTHLMRSPYYYLQQNDQLYVEPNKAKVRNSDGSQVRNISIASAVLSLLVVIFSRF